MSRFEGFAPVCDEHSRLLILGSFPSVMSRAQGFYYGNPQNRFWRTLCGFFGEEPPADTAGKIGFLHRRGVALWDMVASCEIKGSSDLSIRAERVVDLRALFEAAPIERIFCNGVKAYELLAERSPELLAIACRLPSTSPANPRFSAAAWHAALAEVFGAADGENCQKS